MNVKPEIPIIQAPGVYHRKVGDIVVSTVSDGFLSSDLTVMANIDLDEAHEMLANVYRPARRTSVNCFVIFSGDRVAIIDTGSGPYLQPTAGLLFDNLKVLNVAPKDIDTVLLTHLHPDHAGGLTVLETGEKRFPNSEILVHEKELSHWHDKDAQSVATGFELFFFGPAQNQIAPYLKDAVRTFKQGEVFPGVHAIECQGHTPGHTAFLIESNGEQALIWGDMIHVQEIQIPRPEVGVNFDYDVEQAAQSRRKMFDRVASDEILAAGMHTHFPGFGRLRAEKDGFQFHQEAWVHELRGTEL